MVEEPLPPGVHVILGDVAGGTFLQAFHPSRDHLIIDRDVLSCGPTHRCDSLEAWEAMRLQFWNGIVPFGPEELPHSTMGLIERTHHMRDAARVTLWAGTGLSEQLSIASSIHLGAGNDGAGKFSLIQFEYFPGGRSEIYGLGMLNEDAMRAHPAPIELSMEALRDYGDAWAALTSPDPALIEHFGETHPNANRWLRRAMELLLRRFPDRQTGLNFWDHALLAEATTRQLRPRASSLLPLAITRTIATPSATSSCSAACSASATAPAH